MIKQVKINKKSKQKMVFIDKASKINAGDYVFIKKIDENKIVQNEID